MFNSLIKMLKSTAKAIRAVFSIPKAIPGLMVKYSKYYVDNNFRNKVQPIAGSVVYSDLTMLIEHSGIYIDDGLIANITDVANLQAKVKLSDANNFTSKGIVKKIYVSCDENGNPVGNQQVANGANSHVGESGFYGFVFSNCHEFSTKCVWYADTDFGEKTTFDNFIWQIRQKIAHTSPINYDITETWEPTLSELKASAKQKINAQKWLLWDWNETQEEQEQQGQEQVEEPDWEELQQLLNDQPLTPEYIKSLQDGWLEMKDYIQEISDENIPKPILDELKSLEENQKNIVDVYNNNKAFFEQFPDIKISFNDLEKCSDTDFVALAKEMQNNQTIKDLAKKMGRNYISEDKKCQIKVPKASKSEIHGTHRSDDLMRLLPSEMVNLEDEDLEMLFYAKLLEKNLITYQLSGTTHVTEDESYQEPKTTGPVVACLDTSGSMDGQPILKAKALLFAIANILKQEKRSLYVILFGSSGQLKEYRLDGAEDLAGLLRFLGQGFGGGTDFETPLQKSLDIIQSYDDYTKADILMLSDGDCQLSNSFAQHFNSQKQKLDCMVYSVLCDGGRVADNFSDEVVVL